MQQNPQLSQQLTVLIVEDNLSVRRLLRRLLQQFVTQIWECDDGARALAAYRENLPDIVLMDIRMPEMDGITATQQIRQFYPAARIVIVTDCDDDDLRAAAHNVGAYGYALKQDMTHLVSLIDQLVRRETTP